MNQQFILTQSKRDLISAQLSFKTDENQSRSLRKF